MFIFSVKTSKKRLLSSIVCVGLAAIVAVAAWLIVPSDTQASAPGMSFRAANEEERLAFLRQLGLEVDAHSVQVQEIRLPDELDETLNAYNVLQKQAGLDVEPYLGKRVKVYTYRLLNSDNPQLVIANVYVYRNKVIAGDLSSEDPAVASEPLFTIK